MKLLTVEEARERMLAAASPLEMETVALDKALGRVLAAEVIATRDQPPFAASAMDGWAVRAGDAPGRLRIIGESAAGRGFEGGLGPGEAVRIFTGAAVPSGADLVIIQEEVGREGDHIVVPAAAGPRYIRPAAQDFSAGARLLERGARLDPWRLALAAAAGRATLLVARRPRVAILATGDEVVAPGGSPGPFQIFDSGSTAMAALVGAWGGDVIAQASVGDDAPASAAALSGLTCDLIITLGGASVGDHDLIKPALGRLGLVLAVEGVAVRPGKPTWFGVVDDGRRVLGLPGNPASAMVCGELFLRPLLAALQGADSAPRLIPALISGALDANGPREHWMRARLSHGDHGALVAQAFSDQDSALVGVFANADALVRRPAGAPAASPGDEVEVLRLDRR